MDSQVESYSIVPDGRTGAVLMLDTAAGWTLPGHPCAEAGEVNGEVRARFGLTVTVRTRVGEVMDGKRPVYLLGHENHSPGRAPHAGSWRDAAQVAASRLAEPAHRAALDAWFGGLGGALPAGAAWTRPGWFDEAAGWMAERAAEAGRTPAGPVRQVDCTPYSVTLRLPTSAGNVLSQGGPGRVRLRAAAGPAARGLVPGRPAAGAGRRPGPALAAHRGRGAVRPAGGDGPGPAPAREDGAPVRDPAAGPGAARRGPARARRAGPPAGAAARPARAAAGGPGRAGLRRRGGADPGGVRPTGRRAAGVRRPPAPGWPATGCPRPW